MRKYCAGRDTHHIVWDMLLRSWSLLYWPINSLQSIHLIWTLYIWPKTTLHLTLTMTSAQVVKMSVTTTTDNSAPQDYSQPEY